jgi:hypothetical protein
VPVPELKIRQYLPIKTEITVQHPARRIDPSQDQQLIPVLFIIKRIYLRLILQLEINLTVEHLTLQQLHVLPPTERPLCVFLHFFHHVGKLHHLVLHLQRHIVRCMFLQVVQVYLGNRLFSFETWREEQTVRCFGVDLFA